MSDARAIERLARLLEAEQDPDRGRSSSSGFRSASFDRARDEYAAEIERAFGQYRAGSISASELDRRFGASIDRAYRAAYADGASRWGASLTDRDREWIDRAVKGERRYASGFVRDVQSKDPSEEYVQNRAGLYVAALESVRTAAWVEKSPPGTLFDWRLGAGVEHHCVDCPTLAAHAAYTKEELPTYPRAGDTCITTPESRVWTRRGWIPIGGVQVGDEVITHKMRWRRVLATPRFTSARGRLGSVVERGRGIGFTADHLVVNASSFEWQSVGTTLSNLLHLGHVLRDMRQRSEDAEALGTLRRVLFVLRMWTKEGPPRQVLQALLGADPGSEEDLGPDRRGFRTVTTCCGSAVERSGETSSHLRSDRRVASSHSNDLGEALVEKLLPREGWSLLRLLRRGGWDTASYLAGALGLVENHGRAAYEGCRNPPRGSGQDQRFVHQPPEALARRPRSRTQSRVGEDVDRDDGLFPGARMDMRDMREAISPLCEEAVWRGISAGAVLFSGMLAIQLRGSSPAERLGLRDVREACRTLRISEGQGYREETSVLLTGMLREGTLLFDLTVEEDHSFVVEGVVAHNSCLSRCACRLEIVGSDQSAGEPAPNDLRRPHGAAPGGGDPSPQVADQIDDLRARVNYWRREIDAHPEGSEAHRMAVAQRKKANAELIDLTTKHGVRDVPLLSVGDVLGERDLGRDAVDALLRSGLDGAKLGELSAADRSGVVADLDAAVREFLSVRDRRRG